MKSLVLGVCLAAGLITSCGSTTAKTATDASTSAPATSAPSATSAGAVTSAAATVNAGNSFCAYLKDADKNFLVTNAPDLSAADPAAVKKDVETLQTLYREMEKRAPTEIKREVGVIVASTNRLAAIYAKVGFDSKKLDEQLKDPASSTSVEFAKMMSTTDVDANSKVDNYVTKVCGLKG